MLSYFTIGLTICRLATCAGAISANFQSMKTNSTTLGSETSLKMMMVVGVLNFAVLQIVPPNSYPTIPGTPVAKGQVCSVGASCHSLEYKELVFIFLTWVDLTIPFSFPGTLVFAIMVLPACFRQDFVNEAGSHIFLSFEVHDVVQVPDPRVRPIMDKLRLFASRITLPSVPD